MLQMSASGMRPSNPAIIVGGTPALDDGEDLSIGGSVIPLVSVRSGGCLPFCSSMMEIVMPALTAPCARLPWQAAQLVS